MPRALFVLVLWALTVGGCGRSLTDQCLASCERLVSECGSAMTCTRAGCEAAVTSAGVCRAQLGPAYACLQSDPGCGAGCTTEVRAFSSCLEGGSDAGPAVCPGGSPPPCIACTTSDACGAGRVCVDGICRLADAGP